MYTTIADFAKEWEKEAERTERVLSVLTDESLRQPVVSGRRTLGGLAWHLATSAGYMSALGLDFEGVAQREQAPESAGEIAAEYRRISAAVLQAVKTQWSDDHLDGTVMIMGEEWRNGDSMHFTLMHQAHHRGQMTVLMRQAGLRAPDIYGPTYEYWIDQGMKPLE
ncbi:DinB family protein [Paenibacillus sp. GYB004]|uniref:DinB family protein n=1 Tax=Paenibacillus sp. GYB004 TaxID=2994393 RepID=UPI002F96A57C